MDFSKRSYQKELLDGNDIPFEDIERNMRELDIINTWLGGHAISVKGLKQLLKGRKQVTICEIGCGGGDNLRVLASYCRRKNIGVRVTGIDSNAHCIAVAREKWNGGNAAWVHSDYRSVFFADNKPDIIFSSLFCHHFTDDELVKMLQWMKNNASVGFFINDLHRHFLAYNFIKYATRVFSKSYLVKNDAPLSVLRGFKKREWQNIFERAEISDYSLRWKWAFRYLLIAQT